MPEVTWKDAFCVRIPFYVSSSTRMSNDEKLVVGALFASGGEGEGSNLTQEQIGEALNMHDDVVAKSLSNLYDYKFISDYINSDRTFIIIENICMDNA